MSERSYHGATSRSNISDIPRREREMFYLTTHSTHFIYSYMASDIWLRTILIVRKETRCRHIGYSYRLAARDLLYAPSHRQDNTYHGLYYTSRGALAGTRNSSIGIPNGQNRDAAGSVYQCRALFCEELNIKYICCVPLVLSVSLCLNSWNRSLIELFFVPASAPRLE